MSRPPRGALTLGLASLLTAAVVAAAAPVVVRVQLRKEKPDHFLPTPAGSDLRFVVDAAAAPPKARILLLSPLPAGPHHLHLEVSGARAEHTLVVALPVERGRSTFDVRIDGRGRYDFGFWSEPAAGAAPREYRFTLVGPVRQHRFSIELP